MVVGDDARPDLVAGAGVIAGGVAALARHAPASARRIEIGGDLVPFLEALAAQDGDVVVVASGDPGFFGIVRALGERFGRDRITVHPAPSSVSLAFARLGMPWDDAVVLSAHGRPLDTGALRRAAKAAVLTGPGCPPEAVGAALQGLDRRAAVAARLGSPEESVDEVDPAGLEAKGPWPEPNVVVVWRPGCEYGPKQARWAASEGRFAHRDGMITKSEVRAIALARLGAGPGVVVWDIGAGSGSVAVEAAGLGADVWAVERPPATELEANAGAVPGVAVVVGEAPAALDRLPLPHAAFVGGGGPAVVAAVAARRPARLVVALAALDRVAPVRDLLTGDGYFVDVTLLQAWRGADLAGASRLVPQNPVFLVCGHLA